MGPDKSVHSPEYGVVHNRKVHFQQNSSVEQRGVH